MPTNPQYVVPRAPAARAAKPAFLACRAVVQQQRLRRETVAALQRQVLAVRTWQYAQGKLLLFLLLCICRQTDAAIRSLGLKVI